jgi:enoyl-CoA hydratase/carnithine racemase
MENALTHSVKDYIGTITLNRPDMRNAFTLEMLEECASIFERWHCDDSVRVIILTGAGQSFCSGGDVRKMGTQSQTVVEKKSDLWNRMQSVPKALASVDKPVIAMINGDAVGGGMDLALMCDIRVASERARFSEGYVRLGLVPGDGGAFFLTRLIGLGAALEILLTGDFIDAHTAARLGIVNHTVAHDNLEKTTYALAQRIAANPPLSVQATKRLVYQSFQNNMITALELASSQAVIMMNTEDHREAAAAFREKRKAQYKGR